MKLDPGGDRVFGLLAGWGLIPGARAADGEGYELTCPWLDQHTDRTDTGTAYWPGGGFRCHHGHCDGKGREDLLAWVDARVRAESAGRYGLAGLDFRDAEKPLIDAVWRALAAGRVPGRADVKALAGVPDRNAVLDMLRAARAVLGSTNTSAIRRAIRRADARRRSAARHRHDEAHRRAIGTPVPLPANMPVPVSLAEAEAEVKALLAGMPTVSKEGRAYADAA